MAKLDTLHLWHGLPWKTMQTRPHSQQCPKFNNIQWLIKYHRITRIYIFTLQKVTILPIMTDSVFHKTFWIICTGFRLRQRHQTAVLHLNLWKLPHGRYSPAKYHVSEVQMIGYALYFNKKSNLRSKLISRSKKLTSEQDSWIFLKNYLGILRPGSNCSKVWHHLVETLTKGDQSICRYVHVNGLSFYFSHRITGRFQAYFRKPCLFVYAKPKRYHELSKET